jgi:hypothetical protein
MDFAIYENSYLKKFEAIKEYKKNNSLKAKPLVEIIDKNKIFKKKNELIDKKNYLISQDKVQEHKNYINKKNTLSLETKNNLNIKSEFEFKNNNKYKNILPDSFIIKKEGYMSRKNKEPILNNRSTFGYETIKNKDQVSISRPIYWPDRGYLEKTINNDYFKTFYYQ